MSWNGGGNFNRLYSWVADKAAGLNISSVRMDADTNDIAANGFGNCLTPDGQGQPTANLPMANFRHTGVGNGVARNDYAALGQIQDNVVNWAVAVGTPDVVTATLAPPITALTDGQLVYLRASGANTTVAPTFAPNGLAAHLITRAGGSALSVGDIPGALAEIILRYNAANSHWELLNPNVSNIPAGTEVHYAGIQAPPGWYLASGQAASRASDLSLFNTLTITTPGNTHSNTTVDNLAQDLRGLGLEGGLVEGPGIALGTILVSIATTSLTLSQAAVASAAGVGIRFLPYGQGDGSTTFNLPDRRGRTLFGRDNMNGTAAGRLTAATVQGINGIQLAATGGEQAHTQTAAEVGTHSHPSTPWNLRRAVAGEAPARSEKPNFVVQGATVMRLSYDQCLERVLAREGGYTNDPRDPGGPTNFGITIYDYRKYVKPAATAADVKRMSLAEAKRIYRSKYWDALGCDDLPAGVDYTVFDYGVNSGIGRAGKVVRRVLGVSDADWRVNADIVAALKKAEPSKVIVAINDERLQFLKSLRSWSAFGVGWGRRVAEVKAFSLELARNHAARNSGNGAPASKVPSLAPASGKGHVSNLRQPLAVAGAGAAVLAGGGTLAHVAAGIQVWVALLAVAAGIAVVGLFVWRVIAQHHAAQEAPVPSMVPVTAMSTAAIVG
jgi:lysozyme family protein/microcystin-dependent protein